MCSVKQPAYTMASNDVIFRVHYGGRFDRRHRCTYVGGNIGLYEEPYDLDCLSFFEIENVVKKFGYHPGDLVYYCEASKELEDGLVLLTSDEDVVKMADVFLGHKLVVLYIVAFSKSANELVPNVSEVEEGEDDGVEERRMKDVNDPYWRALMSDDENDAWDVPDESEDSDSYFDEQGDSEEGGDSGEEEGGDGGHEEAAQQDRTHVGGLGDPSKLLDDEEEDEVSSNLARSDVLVSPPKSDEEFEATSGVRCVTRVSQFEDVDMEDPHLDVGMSFESAAQFRKAVREYNLFRGKDV
jgi:hypothetical protein